jgi:uncharacterized protein YceK
MRSLAILALILTSLDFSGCSTVRVASESDQSFYQLKHERTHAARSIHVQFTRSLP